MPMQKYDREKKMEHFREALYWQLTGSILKAALPKIAILQPYLLPLDPELRREHNSVCNS
jgi:hypothetical protein